MPPLMSVVVPTLNEADRLGYLLGDLATLPFQHELIVVDGGSNDGTVELARGSDATVIASPPGRGVQLGKGADVARAPLLCFLHADVRLPPPCRVALTRIATERRAGPYAFRLRIDAPDPRYRLIELGANLRSSWFRLPYGDQGLIVGRRQYDLVGGYPPHPLMEDVALVRALNRYTPIRLLPEAIEVSPRRWVRDGVLGRSVRNLSLLMRYLGGSEPARLALRYDRKDRDDG